MKKAIIPLLVVLLIVLYFSSPFSDPLIDEINQPIINNLIKNGCSSFVKDNCNLCHVYTTGGYGCTLIGCRSSLAKCREYGERRPPLMLEK